MYFQAVGFRQYALSRLKSLRSLDNQPVTEEETLTIAKQMTSSRLSLTSLVGVASTISAPPPSLSLLPIAEQLYHSTKRECVLDPHLLSMNDWPSKVTECVCVSAYFYDA